MPEYTIQDDATGRELRVRGPKPPTPEDMATIFAETYKREGFTPPPFEPREPVVPPPIEEVVPQAVLEPVVEPPPEPPPEIEDQSFLRPVADVPLQVGKGATYGVRAITEAFGADNQVSENLRGIEDLLDSLLSAQSKGDSAEVARLQQEAEDKGVGAQVVAALQGIATAPIDFMANAVGTVIPVAAAALVAGLAAPVLGVAAPVAAGAAALGMGTIMGAGIVKGSIFDAVKEELIKQGISEEDAERVAQEAQAYGGENLDQIALGGLLGAYASRAGLEPLLAKTLVKEVAENVAKRGVLASGAVAAAKEAGPEALQGAQEQLARNIALGREEAVEAEVPLMRGVVGAGTLEGLAGALAAGPLGALQAAQQTEDTEGLDTPPDDPTPTPPPPADDPQDTGEPGAPDETASRDAAVAAGNINPETGEIIPEAQPAGEEADATVTAKEEDEANEFPDFDALDAESGSTAARTTAARLSEEETSTDVAPRLVSDAQDEVEDDIGMLTDRVLLASPDPPALSRDKTYTPQPTSELDVPKGVYVDEPRDVSEGSRPIFMRAASRDHQRSRDYIGYILHGSNVHVVHDANSNIIGSFSTEQEALDTLATKGAVDRQMFEDFPNIFEPRYPVEPRRTLEKDQAANDSTIVPDAKKSSGVDTAAEPNSAFANIRNARQAVEYIKKNTSNKLLRNLANRLAPLMGNTNFVVVTDPETQIANPATRALYNEADTQGVYENSSDTMYLHPEKGLNEEVILHEATHKGTVAKVNIYENQDPTNEGLTNKEVESLDKLKSLMEKAEARYKAKDKAGTLTDTDRNLFNAGAFNDLNEFIAYARTNEAMQQFLNGEPSRDGKTTLFGEFVELLRQLFNIPSSQKAAFMELIKASDALFVPETAANAGQVLAAKKISDKKEFRVKKIVEAIRDNIGGARGTLSNMGKLMMETRDGEQAIKSLREALGRMSDAAVGAISKVLTTTDITRWVNGKFDAVRINKIIQEFNKQRNIAMGLIHKRIQPWVEFTKNFPAQAKTLADIMHRSTILNLDMAEHATVEEAIANDEVLNGKPSVENPDTRVGGLYEAAENPDLSDSQRAQIDDEITQRIADIEAMYRLWDEVGQVDNGKAHEIYVMARDAYKETFLKYQELLIEHINNTTQDLALQDKLINMITLQYQNAKQLKVYFPLMRYGNFWIRVGKGPEMEFYMRETAAERDELLNQIVGDRDKDELIGSGEINIGNKLQDGQKELMGSTEELKELFDLLDTVGNSPADRAQLKDSIYQLYLRTLPPGALRRKFLNRQGYTGYSEDALRNFISSQSSSANQLARFEFIAPLEVAIEGAKASVDSMTPSEGKLKYEALFNELSSRARAEINPVIPEGFDFGKLAGLGNQVAFVYMLTSPKSALIQFTQVPIVGIPTLVARGYGKKNVMRVLGGYLAVINRFGKDSPLVGKGMFDDDVSIVSSKYIEDHPNKDQLKAGFERARDLGILNLTYSADISARKKSDSDQFDNLGKKSWRGFVDMMGFLFHHSERLSREIMFMSALELELDRLAQTNPNLSPEAALSAATEKAVEITYETLFNYTLYEKPPVMKHPVGKIATQFLTYPLQMTSFLVRNFFGTIWPTIPKEEKKAAATKLFGTIGMTTLFAGLVGVPGYTAMMGMAEGIREALRPDMDDEDADIWYDENDEGNPLGKRNLDLWFREWWIPTMFGPNSDLASVLGLSPETAQGVARGVEMGPLSALTDWNVGSSVTLDHLWFQDRVPSDDMKGAFTQFLFDTFGGPLGAMGAQIADGIQDVNEGNFDRGLEKFAPAFFRGPMKAFRVSQEGSVTSGQRAPILDAEWYTTGKLLGQALNFQPTTEAEIQKANFLAKRMTIEIQRERTKVLNEVNLAFAKDMENSTARTRANIEEALDAVDEYNYRNAFYPISGNSVNQSITGRATTRAEGDQGLVVPQTQLAPFASDLVRRSRVN